MKKISTALIGLGALAVPLLSAAQSYQIEADASFTRASTDFDNGGDADVNLISFGGRYFLAPVQTVGPWSESAFLQKSSSAGIELSRVSGDTDSDTDFTVDARYVTPADLIVGGELSSDDETDISVFGGKYLDDRTTAIARISLGDIDRIGGEYKTLRQLASGNDLLIEAGLAFVDAADSGLELEGSGTYFLTDQLGVLAGLSFLDIGDFDRTIFTAGAGYFLSETLEVLGALTLTSADTSDATALTIGVVGRF